jgi:hypothetical protein
MASVFSGVIPAKEGVAKALFSVTPAKAGVQNQLLLRSFLDARLRGHDVFSRFATPACAGMTGFPISRHPLSRE